MLFKLATSRYIRKYLGATIAAAFFLSFIVSLISASCSSAYKRHFSIFFVSISYLRQRFSFVSFFHEAIRDLDNFPGREYSEIQAEIPDYRMRGNQEVGAYSVIG